MVRAATKRVGKKCLLIFAIYLLFSMGAVAYDYHDTDTSTSPVCPICFVYSSLSSAVGQATFIPPADANSLCLDLVEGAEPSWRATWSSCTCYRGPPRQDSFLTHI